MNTSTLIAINDDGTVEVLGTAGPETVDLSTEGWVEFRTRFRYMGNGSWAISSREILKQSEQVVQL